MSIINVEVDKAIKDVRTLISELNTLKGAIQGIQGVSSKAFQTLTDRVDKLEKELRQTNSALKTLTVTTRKHVNSMKKMEKQTKRNNTENNNAFKGIGRLMGALGFAGLAISIANVVKQIFTLTVKFQSLGFAIKQTSKDMWEAGRSTQFLLELNNKFGAELVSTTERWLKFRKAAEQSGITLLDTKKIFESVTKASAVMGLRTDELTGVYLALITELDKMMKKGEVLSAEVLPNFAEALEVAYGIESLEKVENLATSIGKMEGAWQSFVLYVVNSESVFSNVLQKIMNEVTSTVKAWTKILGSDSTIFNLDLIDRETALKKRLDTTVSMLTGSASKIKEIDDQILAEKKSMIGATEDEQRESNQRLDELQMQRIALDKSNNEKLKSIAADRFDDARDKYNSDREAFEEATKAKEALSEKAKGQFITDFTEVDKALELTRQNLLNSTAAYNVYRELIEASNTDSSIDEDSPVSANKRKLKFAQGFVATNRIRIAQLKQEVALNKELASTEGATPGDRDRIAQQTEENLKEIARLEKEDRDVAILKEKKKERLKWVAALTKFEEGSVQ